MSMSVFWQPELIGIACTDAACWFSNMDHFGRGRLGENATWDELLNSLSNGADVCSHSALYHMGLDWHVRDCGVYGMVSILAKSVLGEISPQESDARHGGLEGTDPVLTVAPVMCILERTYADDIQLLI